MKVTYPSWELRIANPFLTKSKNCDSEKGSTNEALATIAIFRIYCDRSKNGKNAKEAPRFLSKLAGAEAAKLKKFSDAGGAKSGGCPTPADSHFLSGSSIRSLPMTLLEKTVSVSAIKEGTVIDHIAPGQALNVIRHLKLAATGRVTIGLNLKSDSCGLKDLIKLEGIFITEIQASQIAVFSPRATVNIIENYQVAKKFSVSLPEKIEGLLMCPNARCVTHSEKMPTLFKVEENNQRVLLRCQFCEKMFHRAQIDD